MKMFNFNRQQQFEMYNAARDFLKKNPEILIDLDRILSDTVFKIIKDNIIDFKNDYDEASYLFPFWQNYPPEDRGRMPKGDQFPWIEVGEQVFGNKLTRLLGNAFHVRDCGIPSGPDKRYLLSDKLVQHICKNFTNSCWLFLDIKSVGPRDDQEHTVMSHNQISGDGKWRIDEDGIENSPIIAQGKRARHPFYCAIPPIYVLSDGTIAPVVEIVIKPVYKMLTLENGNDTMGQPLQRVVIITIPNGILLFENPNYLESYPNLFFPGKDDKSKNPKKVRARISFELLSKIDSWRVRTIVI